MCCNAVLVTCRTRSLYERFAEDVNNIRKTFGLRILLRRLVKKVLVKLI